MVDHGNLRSSWMAPNEGCGGEGGGGAGSYRRVFEYEDHAVAQARDWIGTGTTSHLAWCSYLPQAANIQFPRILGPESSLSHTAAGYDAFRLRLYGTYIIYSFDRARHWPSDYLFSSAVRAASSSLVCHTIVNACSGP